MICWQLLQKTQNGWKRFVETENCLRMPILVHYNFISDQKGNVRTFKEAWVTKINHLWLSLKILSSRKKPNTALGHDLIINENVEYEESELRLIIYQIAIGISLHLVILAIFISIPFLTTEFNPRVVTPKITNQNQFGKLKNIYKWIHNFMDTQIFSQRFSKSTHGNHLWQWKGLEFFFHEQNTSDEKSLISIA